MTVYLHDFKFRSMWEEESLVRREMRTCFHWNWPFGVLPRLGLERMEFETVTILHGGARCARSDE